MNILPTMLTRLAVIMRRGDDLMDLMNGDLSYDLGGGTVR